MDDTAKYLIHASISADGVVERSDVVGAVFGQTEGLLGDDLDLRDLQQSSKVGRIDVQISSENGHSFGNLTIASSLDKVKTAILAASLETLTRVGPCQAVIEVTNIEDIREAKRRLVVERAKELLSTSFDDTIMSSSEILEEVQESVRVEDITDYHGLPAGPRVADSDAIIVVEGRADVLTLLRYGIKNAVAVEGTNVPDEVSALTQERTVTTFLDGDRGGELILRELSQVGDVDYVAFAPEDESVEDLDREAVIKALRNKVAFAALPDEGDLRAAVTVAQQSLDAPGHLSEPPTPDDDTMSSPTETAEVPSETPADGGAVAVERTANESAVETVAVEQERKTLVDHVTEVVDGESGLARLLDADLSLFDEVAVEKIYETLEHADTVPLVVIVDGEVSQKLVDIAAQRGVQHVIGRSKGEFVKKPISVRVRTASQLLP